MICVYVCVYGILLRQCTRLLQQACQLAAAGEALNVRIAANVLLLDVDVRDGALAADLLQGVLQLASVRCHELVTVFEV